ncbi:grpE protein homolog 1, mitochondrial-like [Macrobrachium nipponense]|uniref:grpE protein homolog 1, mitochondrial-like n=1 Tax=Macrobrachium nipponense TaxID=159736 RepID=UPI0030C84B9F
MSITSMSKVVCNSLIRNSLRICKTPTTGWTYRCHRLYCAAAEKPAEGTETEKQLQEQIAALMKENENLAEKATDLKDKYQRTLADRENVRVRLQKEIKDAKQYGIQGFCKDLLEVSDVFHKAVSSVPEERIKEGPSDLKTLYDGLVMTENQLLSVFRRHGLTQFIPEIGDKFDPSLQEAMFELAAPDKEPGTVAHVIRSGWKLHARCIRSAQVGVVKDS